MGVHIQEVHTPDAVGAQVLGRPMQVLLLKELR